MKTPRHFLVSTSPAPDLPEVWFVTCVNYTIASQGDSREDSLKMIQEAIEMTWEDCLENGINFFEEYENSAEYVREILDYKGELVVLEISPKEGS